MTPAKFNDGNYYMGSIYLLASFWFLAAVLSTILNIISRAQHSYIVGAVIASAVILTLITNKFLLPEHLLKPSVLNNQAPDEKDIFRRLLIII
jgi:lipopolysaccharide biosynthesis protein